MTRQLAASLLPLILSIQASSQKLSSFDDNTVRAHEIQPHRRVMPVKGMDCCLNQLKIELTVSAAGDVTGAEAFGDNESKKYWPQVQAEIYRWRFKPFEKEGTPVAANIEEHVVLVPLTQHVTPPSVTPESQVSITLQRSRCYGQCPAYIVTISTDSIEFTGFANVGAKGKYTDKIAPSEVRKLAQKFVQGDFYSMKSGYSALVFDIPTYTLSITIDGHTKEVYDYGGRWVGMPAIIRELEDDVDTLAKTERWIK